MSLFDKPTPIHLEPAKVTTVPSLSSRSKAIVKTAAPKSKRIKPLPGEIKIDFITPPRACVRKNCHKKYEVSVTYHRTNTPQKSVKKNILFGDTSQTDYVENGDEKLRSTNIARMRNYDNPLEANYYRLKLLNSEKDLKIAYLKLMEATLK